MHKKNTVNLYLFSSIALSLFVTTNFRHAFGSDFDNNVTQTFQTNFVLNPSLIKSWAEPFCSFDCGTEEPVYYCKYEIVLPMRTPNGRFMSFEIINDFITSDQSHHNDAKECDEILDSWKLKNKNLNIPGVLTEKYEWVFIQKDSHCFRYVRRYQNWITIDGIVTDRDGSFGAFNPVQVDPKFCIK